MSRARAYANATDRQRAYRQRKHNAIPPVTIDPAATSSHPILLSRAVAGPSKWTFSIKPIKALLARYVGDGRGWVDPFAGLHSPAEWTNDLNPQMPTTSHLKADEFCRGLEGPFLGVLYDPPYSYRQVSDCYKMLGLPVQSLDTSSRFYNAVMNLICDKLVPGGLAISCGWNSNGFGRQRGFVLIEQLNVAHGQHRYDTLVTVERKVAGPARGDAAPEEGGVR